MQPREKMKYICVAQPAKEMAPPGGVKVARVLGTQAVVNQISRKERLQRKKYMGVCRHLWAPTREMMPRFPATVSRYMTRKRRKSPAHRLRGSGKPSKMNGPVWTGSGQCPKPLSIWGT